MLLRPLTGMQVPECVLASGVIGRSQGTLAASTVCWHTIGIVRAGEWGGRTGVRGL